MALPRWFLLGATCVACGVAPALAGAEPTGPCHCFHERTYDPLRPAAADPYILATTRSSTLSVVFGADKATLVRDVMSGTSPEDLWIAYWAAARTERDPRALLEDKRAAGSWKAAIGSEDPKRLGAAFSEALKTGATDTRLGDIAVDDVVISSLRVDADVVRATRKAGARSPEVILSALLAPRLRMRPPQLVAAVQGGKSWGALLSDAGIAPKSIGEAVADAVKAGRESPR